MTAARRHGIIDALAQARIRCWADKAYQGADHHVRFPFRGRRHKRWKRRHFATTHTKIRCAGDDTPWPPSRAGACYRKLRCSTNRITDIVQAVLVLHHASA
ncbi:hypothetical protein [Streptomyces noursei]|uniref:hypothetical protein n=1 Tax=Streptomyces noursei TaxID=1971 RepID=UPI0037D9E69F